MAGLVPAIHVLDITIGKDVDTRDKRGHDEGERKSQSSLRRVAPHLPCQFGLRFSANAFGPSIAS